MKIFINGEPLSLDFANNANTIYNADYKENVIAALSAWNTGSTYSFGYPGENFLNITTSGTTGHPIRVGHSRETIEQVVQSNIQILNLHKDSKILAYYSPKGIAFTTLSVFLCATLGCELYIEPFKGIDYVNTIHNIRPTHTLLLPNVWKTLYKHTRWNQLDYSSVETLITGSDFTPIGMLEELRNHNPGKVYNVYGSTEVPPIVLYSEEENIYSIDNKASGIDLKIEDSQIFCKWSSQNEYWKSGDCVEMFGLKFKLNGRMPNMFKQGNIRVYPEQIEKDAVAAGADLALCQQVNNQCMVYYTGHIKNMAKFVDQHRYIPRFRIKAVTEIKTDDNLKKIIRTQTL